MVPTRCGGLRVFLRLDKQDGKDITLCVAQTQQSKMLKEHVVLPAEISISLNHKKIHLLVVKVIFRIRCRLNLYCLSFLNCTRKKCIISNN